MHLLRTTNPDARQRVGAGGRNGKLASTENTAFFFRVQHPAVAVLCQRYGLSLLHARVTVELAGFGRVGAA